METIVTSPLAQYIAHVVPADSIICLARQRISANASIGRPALNFDNRFFTHSEIPNAEAVVAEWNSGTDTDVYISPAGYASKASRKKTNVALLRSLFIDVDMWSETLAKQPGKRPEDFWHSKADALRSLKRLCIAIPALPPPLVVDSGRGLHVYFLLTESITPTQWAPLAKAFREAVRKHEPRLIADGKRTIDAASVLRLPGTFNVKDKTNPLAVRVVVNGAQRVDYAVLMSALGSTDHTGLGLPPDYAKGTNTFSVGNPHRREFKDIEPRPVLTQCAQMRHHLEAKGAVSEPEWLLACRVFVTLRDGDSIAHKFSNPAFKGAITRKLNHARTNFDAPSAACKEWPHRNRCAGCNWSDTVLYPVEIAEHETSQREARDEQAEAVIKASQVAIQGSHTSALPTGYLKLRAAYEQVTTPAGQEFTHVPGINRENPGQTLPLIRGHMNVKYTSVECMPNSRGDMRVHMDVTINGHTSEITIPTVDLTAERIDTATKGLRGHGLTIDSDTNAKRKALLKLFAHIVEVASTRMVPYFPIKGWDTTATYGRQALTVGSMRYLPDGSCERGISRSEHIGGTSRSKSIIEAFCSGVPRGTLHDWQKGMEIYNRPGLELAQMLLMSGVANLLLPLVSPSPGGILLALTGEAGVGKTTLLRFLSSFVGDPTEGMVPGSSTSNALVNMLSQAGFLLLPVDDSFKMDATVLSLLLSSVSSGMEKARLTGSAESGWASEMAGKFNSSLIITTNFDIGTIIGSGRANDAQMLSDAARSRLLEVTADRITVPDDISPAQWRVAEGRVLANFGHALDIFARYVSTRQVAISNELHMVEASVQAMLLEKAPVAARGVLRFWAKYLACVYTASKVLTVNCPILPWNATAILKAGMELAVEHDREAKVDKSTIVNQFWDMFISDRDGKRAINRSYMVVETAHGWPVWHDMRADQQRARIRKWDDNTYGRVLISGHTVGGTSIVTLHTVFDWRVIITKVLNHNGSVSHYEREVIISMDNLNNLIARHAGFGLRVSDWVEAYQAFKLNGAVAGVKPYKPKRYASADEHPVRIPIEGTESTRGSRRLAVKLVFPPLPPEDVEPA